MQRIARQLADSQLAALPLVRCFRRCPPPGNHKCSLRPHEGTVALANKTMFGSNLPEREKAPGVRDWSQAEGVVNNKKYLT